MKVSQRARRGDHLKRTIVAREVKRMKRASLKGSGRVKFSPGGESFKVGGITPNPFRVQRRIQSEGELSVTFL